MSGIHSDGLPAQVLKHLAENGPTERGDLNTFMHTIASPNNADNAIARLRDKGFIRVKIWLTPEGLAEIKRHGWEPDLAGVTTESSAP
jgi:hypothetical protein